MKKTLLLLASAALLLVGCQKEKFAEEQVGGLTEVTFTASLESGVATKAVTDGDGAAVNVNRCIMEIYYGDDLFTRKIVKVTDKKATFTAQVVSNRTYKVAFWADCVDDATTDAGLATDKYYTTTSLREIAIKGNYSGNDDARDAFYHVGHYTIAQVGNAFGDIKLKRPFAQMNVITTDWDKVASIAALKPEKVYVTLKNALVSFNALTGEASGSQTLTYTADVYEAPAALPTALENEKTLSMDYLFASDTKALIDIDWKAQKDGNTDVEHAFAAVPYQRNYRTNIKGALLTTQGQWTVEVDPIWSEPAHEKLVVATTVLDIEGMNTFVTNHPDADQIDVTFSAEPNDAGVPTQGGDANAIVTSTLKANSDLNVTIASDTKTLYVGDFVSEKDITVVETSKAATVNITVPQGNKIETLVINAPFKSVYLNGQQITGGVGTLTNVEATTSEHTLVVEAGQSIGTLTVHQGGLEIHGTVGTLVINETAHETNPVLVRTSENLSESVFAAIKGVSPAHNFIDTPFFVEKQNGSTWDIVPSVVLVGSIENPTAGYATLEQAIAATTSGTLFLTADVETAAEITVGEGKDITLNLNGHKLNSGNHSAFQIVGGKLNITGAGEIDGTPSTHKEIYLKGSIDANASDYSVLSVGPQVSIKCTDGYAIMISNNSGKAYGAKINIDGTVEGEYGALYVNGTIQALTGNIPVITVNGKLVVDEENAAIYAAGYAKYIINEGAVLTGNDAMYICGGDVEINGGTFRAIGPAHDFEAVTSGYQSTGEAIVVDSREGYAQPIKLCIKGGDFTSEHNRPVGSYPVGSETKRFIQGGTYSAELPELYIDEGYNQVRIPNGKYLVQGKTAAHLNGHDYITIAKALEAFGEITEPGDYDLTIEPGIYRESDLMLILQNPNIQKKLTIKPAGEKNSVTIMPGDKSTPLAVFVLVANSDYSGAAIVFDGINVDLSDTPTPTSDIAPFESTPYLPVFYMGGAPSRQIDALIDALRPGLYNGQNNPRYVHDITIKNCEIVGNGDDTQVVVGNTGTSKINVENCKISDAGYFANGYFITNAGFGIHATNVDFSGGTFINNQSGGDSEISVEGCTIKCNKDYAIRTSGSANLLNKFDHQFIIKNTTIEVDGAELDKDAGVIYFRSKETHALIENCTVTKKNIIGNEWNLYDIYNKNTTVTINGKNLPSGPGVGMEWLTATE